MDIIRRIKKLLTTKKGSIEGHRDYGTDIHKYVDYPLNRVRQMINFEILEALEKWIPEAHVSGISLGSTQGKLEIKIRLDDGRAIKI